MSTIAIQDLRPLGSDLFMDHESYLRDMSSDELTAQGGKIPPTYTVFTGPVSVSVSLTIGITALTVAISVM